jgi:hypothetical protein
MREVVEVVEEDDSEGGADGSNGVSLCCGLLLSVKIERRPGRTDCIEIHLCRVWLLVCHAFRLFTATSAQTSQIVQERLKTERLKTGLTSLP